MRKRTKFLSADAWRTLDSIRRHQMRTSHQQAGMSIQRAANPPESRGGALWSVLRGEAFDPQGGAPTDKSDAVRHFVVGSLCRNQREPVAALPPPASKEVLYEQNQSNPA